MPRPHKQRMKRTFAQGYIHLDEAGERLYTLYTIFEPHHKDYAEYILSMLQTIDFLQRQYRKLGELAWGSVPEDLRQWR